MKRDYSILRTVPMKAETKHGVVFTPQWHIATDLAVDVLDEWIDTHSDGYVAGSAIGVMLFENREDAALFKLMMG